MGILSNKKTHLSAISLLLLFITVGVLSYWPSFFGERIWDDHFLIGKNPFFRSPALIWECYQHWLYPFSNSTYFRPTQNVTYIFDYWVWGESLFGYHLTNVLIHAGAAFLLGLLFRRIVKTFLKVDQYRYNSDLLAWGTALLWLVHPIHHAGIAYISGRADSLAALFAIAAWLLCEHGIEQQSRIRAGVCFTFAAACGWLALCSKEIALTWFGLFAIYHAFFHRERPLRQRLSLLAGAALLVVIYAFHRTALPRMASVNDGAAPESTAFLDRIPLILRALGDYASLILCPANLHMERQLTPPVSASGDLPIWLKVHSSIILPLGIVVLLCVFWLCFTRSPSRKLYQFAACWFFLGFLPISNLFPLNATVAEHWVYMPSAAFILVLAKALLSVPISGRSIRVASIGVACLILVILTHEQSRYWISEENFFRTTIARGGDTPRAWANLARILEAKGDMAQAETILKEAVSKHPEYSALKAHLAALLTKLKRPNEASQIVGTKPDEKKRPPVPWNWEIAQVQALLATDKLVESQDILSRTLARWPLAWDVINLQVRVHEMNNEPEKSVDLLSAYVAHNWWHYTAVIQLARSLAGLGRDKEAIEKYHQAARLDIHAVKPFEQIASISLRQKLVYDALVAQTEAADRAPDSLAQHERLAQLYEMLGRKEEAEVERMILPHLVQSARDSASE